MGCCFAKLLPELLREYGGSKQDLARAIHITPSSFSHIAAGNVSPSVAVCLRLAHECGVSASKILRAADRSDVADLIEGLYGDAAVRRFDRGPRFSRDELRRVERIRTLSPRARRAIDVLIMAAAATAINDDQDARDAAATAAERRRA